MGVILRVDVPGIDMKSTRVSGAVMKLCGEDKIPKLDTKSREWCY